MNGKKYKWLLYFIVFTILLTVVVQGYWNYENYLKSKQSLNNDVQISLDNALDTYFADLAEYNHMSFANTDSDSLNFKNKLTQLKPDSIFTSIQKEFKSNSNKRVSGFTQIIANDSGFSYSSNPHSISKIKVIRGKKAADSLKLLKNIASIYISIKNDTLDLDKLKPILTQELLRKGIDTDYALIHKKNDTVFNSLNALNISEGFLNTQSKSTFLKENESLEIAYSNSTKIILKQMLSSLLISTLLIFAVISCMFYLLKIIKKQKQLAEVKNDLISNITHEFKTPIATIGVAIESIKNFNVIDDKEKTKNYLDISDTQLSKLNTMVEKLLETASLESDSLKLNKEEINVSDLLDTIANKHKLQTENKTINFFFPKEAILAKVDIFHFENAINNIVDNAIKYGGDTINIELSQNDIALTVSISDNGNTLSKVNKDNIFEKFYRVPKGNTHDIKGFGIGLYYTKKIIEKHNGTIHLDLDNMKTTFKISLPNE
tara:strand:- start:2510 stop:3979 length:1470 start_codon:yes stop_codon:yes gene_type:complete